MSPVLKHILCVDDEEDILEVVKMCLETVGGFKVSSCDDGVEALGRIEAIKPDLVLLDVMMPHMDGPSTLKVMRAKPELAHIPVIFMTARVQPLEVELYMKTGAAGVIAKPFDPMTLPAQVESCWKSFWAHPSSANLRKS